MQKGKMSRFTSLMERRNKSPTLSKRQSDPTTIDCRQFDLSTLASKDLKPYYEQNPFHKQRLNLLRKRKEEILREA